MKEVGSCRHHRLEITSPRAQDGQAIVTRLTGVNSGGQVDRFSRWVHGVSSHKGINVRRGIKSWRTPAYG
jgi:hypothetical protein